MDDKYSILTCASYGASGSGIVTDYLMEFDNIDIFGTYIQLSIRKREQLSTPVGGINKFNYNIDINI